MTNQLRIRKTFDQSMVSSIYWLCLGIIDYLFYHLFAKIKVFARKKYFYRFINFLTSPPFSVLFFLIIFVLNSSPFKRIRIRLNFARQSKKQFIYLFNLLGLLLK